MSSSTDDGVPVGRIGRPHGVRGEVTVVIDTDDASRFAPGAPLVTDDGRELTVRSAAPYRDRGLVVGFEGVTDRSAAERLRGAILLASRSSRRALDDGEFWPDDLVGLAAVDPGGAPLGTVIAVDPGAGQARLVIATDDGTEVLVPFVAEIVGDPSGGTIEVRDPGGLFPE